MDQGQLDQVLANAGFVRQLARALARDDHEADDVAQEVLVRALPPPRGLSMDLRSWLAGVTRNVFRMGRRTEFRRHRRERNSAQPEQVPSAAEQTERLELLDQVVVALAELEEPYRSVVMLRYCDQYSPPEIARLTSTPLNTVKTRLRRGLNKLRATLSLRDGRGPVELRSGLLLLAGRPMPLATPTAAAGTATLVLTGAFLMSTKLKAVLAVLILLALGTTLHLLPSPEADREPVPVEPGWQAPPPLPGEQVDRVAVPSVESARGPGSPNTPGGHGEPPGGEEGVVAGQVVDADGHPVVGAGVRVHSAVKGALTAHLFAHLLSAVPGVGTDDQGRFRVTELKDGEYNLTVRAAGFLKATVPARPGGDALRVVLSKGLELSGMVTVEGTGEALTGIILRVRPASTEYSQAVGEATSREDGSFNISGLRAGSYLIEVSWKYQVIPGPTGEFIPARVGPVQAGARDVRVKLMRGLSISGRIEDDRGDALTTQVSIDVIGFTAAGDADPLKRRNAWSDTNGNFRISGLPEGDYRLTFKPEPGMEFDARRVASESMALTVLSKVPAGTVGLRVRMKQGMVLQGRLEDENGEPIAGHGAIFVYPTGSHPARGGGTVLLVHVGGNFKTIPLDLAQSYDILATGFSGHNAAQMKGVLPGTPNIVLILRRASRITGKVLDEHGKPVPAGVGVRAFAPAAPSGATGSTATAYTRGDGSFALEGLGEFAFRIRAGGAKSTFKAGEAIEGVRPNADPIVLRVSRGVRFSGRLVDHEGRPVITNIVMATQPNDAVAPMGTVRDKEGNFTIAGLAPGKLTLFAYLGGAYVKLGEFTAPATDIEVVVPR